MKADELDERGQSLVEHLGELRTRIVHSLWALLIATFICFHYAETIFNNLRKPIEPYLPQGGLIYTGPLDKFMAYVKIAIVAGIVISCPFWLWQIWKFVAPGLYKRERGFAIAFIGAGSALFVGGVSFAYFVVLPMAFHFLMTFGGETDKPMIAIDSYLSFVSQITLMFGVSFELPLIMTLLGLMGVVSRRFLAEKRRYAVMVMAVVSAVVTPPDLLSMVLMLAPMLLLYEVGVLMVGLVERRRRDSRE